MLVFLSPTSIYLSKKILIIARKKPPSDVYQWRKQGSDITFVYKKYTSLLNCSKRSKHRKWETETERERERERERRSQDCYDLHHIFLTHVLILYSELHLVHLLLNRGPRPSTDGSPGGFCSDYPLLLTDRLSPCLHRWNIPFRNQQLLFKGQYGTQEDIILASVFLNLLTNRHFRVRFKISVRYIADDDIWLT